MDLFPALLCVGLGFSLVWTNVDMFLDFCLWVVDLGVIGFHFLKMIFGSVACLQRVRKDFFLPFVYLFFLPFAFLLFEFFPEH